MSEKNCSIFKHFYTLGSCKDSPYICNFIKNNYWYYNDVQFFALQQHQLKAQSVRASDSHPIKFNKTDW